MALLVFSAVVMTAVTLYLGAVRPALVKYGII